jgi:glycosyltransferase involved in cell wall biosynthesis
MVKLSVVMAVYDGAAELPRTLASIFDQSESDFELLVVDDGSRDDTPALLRACRDPRLRVITQANAGLTAALVRGCAEASAPVIARHDNGDRSDPRRFAAQLALMRDDVVLVSCATRVVGPGGEPLFVSEADGDAIREGLLHGDVTAIRSIPHHGSAMFRRDAYLEAGGYRAQFRVAQDLDLWIRLARLGRIAIAGEPLYEATFDAHGISGGQRAAQTIATAVAVQLRDRGPRAELLQAAANIPRGTRDDAAGHYFIASCLLRNGDPRWREYAKRAVRSNPFHLRAWLRLLTGR